MKNIISNLSGAILCLCVVAMMIPCLVGCNVGPSAGETKAEIDRRHHRVHETGWLEVQDDLDAMLLLDRPTRLTDKFVR